MEDLISKLLEPTSPTQVMIIIKISGQKIRIARKLATNAIKILAPIHQTFWSTTEPFFFLGLHKNKTHS